MKSNLWLEKNQLVERTLDSKEMFQGNLLRLYLDRVSLPDGTTSSREWIAHPGACAIVPVFEDGTIMMVKQYRYPLKQIFFEVPAGKIDPLEDPKLTAARETSEETGLTTKKIAYVGHFYPVIGYSDEVIHIYTAWNLTQEVESLDRDEFLVTERISFQKAIDLVEEGIITDGKSICALYQTRAWWKRQGPFPVPLR